MAKLKINGDLEVVGKIRGGGGIRSILDIVYPIGALIELANNVNPNDTMFGQVWEPWGQGRVVVGAGTGTDDNGCSQTFNLDTVGGEYCHQLGTNEMASHTHTRGSMNITGGFDPWGWSGEPDGDFSGAFYKAGTGRNSYAQKDGGDGYRLGFDAARDNAWTGETSSVGGNTPHNNVQPYAVANRWVRTA